VISSVTIFCGSSDVVDEKYFAAALKMINADFGRRFAGTALIRRRAAGTRKNARIALENAGRAAETMAG
jgi:hypothetical protein